MLHSSFLILAALVTQDSWSALPLPRICEEPMAGHQRARMSGARHLLLDDASLPRASRPRASLAAGDLGALLQQCATDQAGSLRISPYSPPLYVQGNAADLKWARGVVEAIDEAGQRRELSVSAWLIPDTVAVAPSADGTLPEGSEQWHQSLTSGKQLSFGGRLRQDFVASYDVEVASHSGVAAPIIGQITSGRSLHLGVSRVDGGTRYHLRGRLDLAVLDSLESFDPGTPDLGLFTQPVVHSVSLSFSAVGDMGSFQRIQLQGGPSGIDDCTLWIRVEGAPEPVGARTAGSAVGHDWRAVEVSLLERRPPDFQAVLPGAGLSGSGQLAAVAPAAAPISAAGVLGAIQGVGRSGRDRGSRTSDGGRTPMQVCEGLLLIAASETIPGQAEHVSEFVRAAEAPKLQSSQVDLQLGSLKVSFPSAFGEVARLWAGSERTFVTGYNSEIAPNSWMPAPKVEFALDGLAWQGRLDAHGFPMEAWAASTQEVQTLSREDVQLGAVQLPKRRIQSAGLKLLANGEAHVFWGAGAQGAEFTATATVPD